MQTLVLRTTMALALTLFASACDDGGSDPQIDASAEQGEAEAIQAVLATEHLEEMAFDNGDFAAHMALWSDSEFEFVSPFGSFTDRDEYEAWVTDFYGYAESMGGTRHHVLNPVVTIDGDTAEFTGYLQVINRSDGSFMGSSVMHDRLVRTDAGWRFVYRSVELDQTP